MISSNIETQKKIWGQEELLESRDPAIQNKVRSNIRQLLDRLNCQRWLDLGGYRGDLSENLNATVQDLNITALQEAQTKLSDAVQADIHLLPYQNNSFDGILMSHVLEHASEPKQVLNELARVIQPKGRLVIIVPNAASWGQLFKLAFKGEVKPAGNIPGGFPEHLYQFTLKNSTYFFKAEGWDIMEIQGDCMFIPFKQKLHLNWLSLALRKWFPKWSDSLIFILKKHE